MRLTFFILLFFLMFPSFSQNNSSAEIDSLLIESYQKFNELQFIESSNIAKQARELSILNNYSKGIVKSNISIAKVLIEVGLDKEALKYIQDICEEPTLKEEILVQSEYHRLKGKIYGNQHLYSLAKEEFLKQLYLSERILDSKNKALSKLWVYQNIETIYSMQGVNDSIEVYQELQEEQLLNFDEHEVFTYISSLHSNRGLLYLNKNRMEEAVIELQKSIDILDKYNFPYRYYVLRIFGDLEAERGNIDKAISYYNEALENSILYDANNTSRELHKKLAEYLFDNDLQIDKAKQHLKDYTKLNDSLEHHNRSVVDAVFNNIIKGNEDLFAKKIDV